MIAARVARLRERMAAAGVDTVIVGPSADYRWLTGLHPPIPTRLTLAIVPLEGDPVIVTPGFEAPADAGCEVVAWSDGTDADALAADLLRRTSPARVAVSDRTWARYVLPLQAALGARFEGAVVADRAAAVGQGPGRAGRAAARRRGRRPRHRRARRPALRGLDRARHRS